MKLMHLGDLHIGKRVNEFPMLEDQKEILNQIFDLAKKEKVDGIMIAGDVYDKSIPSVEAIEIFENFIEKITELKIPAYIVSGNHDSVERLSAFSNLIRNNQIYISKSYNGKIEPIQNEDCAIWLLPFIRPADVRKFHPDIEIGSYQDAVQKVIENLKIDKAKINILVAHQFVTANGISPKLSDSEVSSLGTLDNVDFSVFDKFDYVALGHIHKPQTMGRKEIRYCGSPLKYSFSEVNQKKSITIIKTGQNKKIKTETFELSPLRDMKEIKGSLDELLKYPKDESYMHITLTDTAAIDAKNKLESIFPNIMKLDFEEYDRITSSGQNLKKLKEKNLAEHFADFFEKQTNQKLNKEENEIIAEILGSIQGEETCGH